MRSNLLSRCTGLTIVFLIASVVFYSCSKEPGLSGKTPEKSAGPIVTYAPSNKPISTVMYLKNGDTVVYEPGKKPSGLRDPNARVNGCGADPFFWPPSTYHGYTAYLSGCPSDPSTTITLSFTIETHSEYNLVPNSSTTKGRLKLVGNLLYPTTTKTAPLTATYASSYYNSYGEEVNIFYLTFSITLNVSEYCNYEEISVGTTGIPTDCIDVAAHTVSNTTDYLTPQTYKIYPYIATSTSTGQMTVFPGITLCQNCHDPALGISPTHVFEYRLQGTSTWTAVTYNNLNTQYISVASGTYEYRSKGIITPGVYGAYTPVYTVTVL